MSFATLSDNLAGSIATPVLLTTFYRKLLEDDELAPYFKNTDMVKQEESFSAFSGALFAAHTEIDYPWMGISLEHYAHVVAHLLISCWDTDLGEELTSQAMDLAESLHGAIVKE
jgi:hypothetical protein